MLTEQEARDVKRRHSAELLSKPGVSGSELKRMRRETSSSLYILTQTTRGPRSSCRKTLKAFR